jgi:hypothetical protein
MQAEDDENHAGYKLPSTAVQEAPLGQPLTLLVPTGGEPASTIILYRDGRTEKLVGAHSFVQRMC